MKVSNHLNKPPVRETGAGGTAASSHTSNAASSLSSSAAKSSVNSKVLSSASQVDISPQSQDFKKALELAKSSKSQDINEAKVARLQKLIDSGEYKVNAEAVADRLVDEHLMLPS